MRYRKLRNGTSILETVAEGKSVIILSDFTVHTDRKIDAQRLDIINQKS